MSGTCCRKVTEHLVDGKTQSRMEALLDQMRDLVEGQIVSEVAHSRVREECSINYCPKDFQGQKLADYTSTIMLLFFSVSPVTVSVRVYTYST